jgi:hypothetical protein
MSGNKFNTTQSDDSDGPGVTEDAADIEQKGNKKKKEIGGRDGPEPTRYGDWEKNGRCIDF